MLPKLLMASAALIYSATLSWAADPVVAIESEAAFGPKWTGFHIGVHGGAAFGKMGYEQLGVFPGDPDLTYLLGAEDFAYGVHAGFDYQFSPRWVGGIQFDYTEINAEYNPNSSGGFGNLAEVSSIFAVSARAGYLLTPSTLIYGRLGYAGIRIEDAEDSFGDLASGTVDAVVAGVGAETFITRNITARVDASYYAPTERFVFEAGFEELDPRHLVVTAGLSYRFGAENGSAYAAAEISEQDFSGFYVGLSGSYSLGLMEFDVDVPGATVGPFGSQTPGAGIFAGYDFAINSTYVLGIEAEATYLEAEFKDPALNLVLGAAPPVFATIEGVFSLTTRAGYIATPSTMVYVKGGIAGLYTEANDEFFALDGGDSEVLPAYQVGAGIESALTDRITLRVEGLYTKAFEVLTVSNTQIDQNELTPSLLTGKVGIAYRF